MGKNKQSIGIISGKDLLIHREGKASRIDGSVKSGTGYHKSKKDYNRKGKNNQQLKNKLKNFSSGAAVYFMSAHLQSLGHSCLSGT